MQRLYLLKTSEPKLIQWALMNLLDELSLYISGRSKLSNRMFSLQVTHDCTSISAERSPVLNYSRKFPWDGFSRGLWSAVWQKWSCLDEKNQEIVFACFCWWRPRNGWAQTPLTSAVHVCFRPPNKDHRSINTVPCKNIPLYWASIF